MRVACVSVPELDLQAHRRAQPELAEAPLAVVLGRGSTARVIELSAEARALGVRLGLTAAAARAIAPSLVALPRDPARSEAARAALADAALALGTQVARGAAEVWIEVGDLGRMFASERAIALELQRGARAVGLRARVGIASSKGVSRLAARCGADEIQVVPPGREQELVAPLPVAALAPGDEAAAALARWGVRSCGQLAALPSRAVALRLGGEGARLARLAAGRCDEPLRLEPPAEELEEGTELDFELADLEALGFVLRGLSERLIARLGARHLACGGVALRLGLAPTGVDAREVRLAAPTRDPRTLQELIRLAVAERPPPAPVIRVALVGRPARGEVAQLDLWRPSGPAPDRLAATVARLEALVGAGNVGAPSACDTFRDEEIAVGPYAPGRIGNKKVTGTGTGTGHDDGYGYGHGGGEGKLGLRRFRPAKEVEVLVDGGCVPRVVTGIGSVVVAAGPYRVSGEWWVQGGFARDHWDVHAADGALYRIYRDAAQRWFLEGYYD